MAKDKIAITLGEEYVGELDRLVREHVFSSRSQAIEEAVSEKLSRLKHSRLAIECSKLDPVIEKSMAEEGINEDAKQWPQY